MSRERSGSAKRLTNGGGVISPVRGVEGYMISIEGVSGRGGNNEGGNAVGVSLSFSTGNRVLLILSIFLVLLLALGWGCWEVG